MFKLVNLLFSLNDFELHFCCNNKNLIKTTQDWIDEYWQIICLFILVVCILKYSTFMSTYYWPNDCLRPWQYKDMRINLFLKNMQTVSQTDSQTDNTIWLTLINVLSTQWTSKNVHSLQTMVTFWERNIWTRFRIIS